MNLFVFLFSIAGLYLMAFWPDVVFTKSFIIFFVLAITTIHAGIETINDIDKYIKRKRRIKEYKDF